MVNGITLSPFATNSFLFSWNTKLKKTSSDSMSLSARSGDDVITIWLFIPQFQTTFYVGLLQYTAYRRVQESICVFRIDTSVWTQIYSNLLQQWLTCQKFKSTSASIYLRCITYFQLIPWSVHVHTVACVYFIIHSCSFFFLSIFGCTLYFRCENVERETMQIQSHEPSQKWERIWISVVKNFQIA